MRIFLDFSPEQTATHRSRLGYAFRVFCAIYGHQPVLDAEQAQTADVWIRYAPGSIQGQQARPSLELSSLYQSRSLYEAAPPPKKFEREGESTALFYSPLPGQEPDWLSEIFEWVSSADEYSVRARDSVGRVAFAETYLGRHKLDVRVPYAAVAMRFLQQALCRLAPGAVAEPRSPVESAGHFVVPTHDVDYFPVGRLNSVHRLAKNAAISCWLYKSLVLGMKQAGMALRSAIGGPDALDQIPALARGETRRNVSASYYFLLRRYHRRDANYDLGQPSLTDFMAALERQGLEVGVHGSYTSLDEPGELAAQFDSLRARGFRPLGGRQHWLRFTLDRLIPAHERARALYDSSMGWPDRMGFRSGACFAYPPYNFEQERPATFIEIPLVMMDQSLQVGPGQESDWYNQVADLLSVSRRYGWGGISLLWHPAAFGGGWLSKEVGNVFWRLMDSRNERQETWLSATEFVRSVRQRYIEVGLLPEAYGPEEPEEQVRQAGRSEFAVA